MLTFKDRLILAQSQLQRAIEVTQLCGFPEELNDATYKQKMKYITQDLTPKLMKVTVQNAKDADK